MISNKTKIKTKIGEIENIYYVDFKKLYGIVKLHDGRAVKNPVIISPEKELLVVGDENGYFEVIISGKVQLAVFDKNYSKENLEVWLENVDLKEDTEINVVIGKAEVFGLCMWRQIGSDYIFFIPMSLSRIKALEQQGIVNELEIITNKEAFARLNKEDIKVFVDEEPVKILTISEVEDYISEVNGQEIKRYAYVISIPKVKSNKNKFIKIAINCRFRDGDDIICDIGEGYYFL